MALLTWNYKFEFSTKFQVENFIDDYQQSTPLMAFENLVNSTSSLQVQLVEIAKQVPPAGPNGHLKLHTASGLLILMYEAKQKCTTAIG